MGGDSERGRPGIDAKGGEQYPEPDREETRMAMLLDNDFHLYREADSDAELFSSSVGDAQVNKVMSLLCSPDFSHYQLQHAITQISQFLKFQQMRNVKSNMQAPLLCRKKWERFLTTHYQNIV